MVQEILLRFQEYKRQGIIASDAYSRISYDLSMLQPPFPIKPDSVYRTIRRFRPTVDMAALHLKASAYRLARRVVNKASVEQSIDILSRSNMGVLAPAKAQMSGPTGFFLSVKADTCGAVTVGAAIGELPASPTESTTLEFDLGEIYEDPRPVVTTPVSVGGSRSREAILEAARAKILAARQDQDAGREGGSGEGVG
jgi:hypothetical protein